MLCDRRHFARAFRTPIERYDPDAGGPLDITDADIELLLAGR